MDPRILVRLIAVGILVTACSGTAAAPPSSSAPTGGRGTAPTPAVIAPAASALTGEVPVTMTDAMRFAPDPITVKVGEPITFIVTNTGLIVHEFFVGTAAEQEDHAAEMALGAMTHGHDTAVSLEPGKTSSLTMTFADAGSLLIGCHEPGHYDAGMKATLTVVD